MCELLGIEFARPVFVDVSIRAFALRDEENADGWGLAWYPDRSLAIAKEPLTWRQSEFADFLQTYAHLRSCIYIGHVRKKTVGGKPTHADTHPFVREFGGREYCFAHNGTLYGARQKLRAARYKPIGATDSERALCYLLDQLADRGTHLENRDDWRWLHAMFAAFNRMGKCNCLLSDGRRLFCYHDVNAFKGLWVTEMATRQHQWQHLDDQAMHVDVETSGRNTGSIVASNPLNANGWRRFAPGEMIVLEHGRIAYAAQPPATMAGGPAQ